jgi:hypothetical protein
MPQVLYHSYGKTGIAAFVMPISVEPGMEARRREISETEDHSCLRELRSPYYGNFGGKKTA